MSNSPRSTTSEPVQGAALRMRTASVAHREQAAMIGLAAKPHHTALVQTPAPPDLPERVGDYSIIGRIARGHLTEILLARTEGIGGINREVVIKLLRPEVVHAGRFIRSFLHEERVTGMIRHPNAVTLLGSHHTDRGYAMVLEYIDGWSLDSVLQTLMARGQTMPLDVAASIVHSVAEALHHLHELSLGPGQHLGLVHNDVTPSNIIMSSSGFTKLIDFGDVTIAGMERARPAIVMATKTYVPPEALRGDRLARRTDRRGDVYNLGVVLYELTTGRPLTMLSEAARSGVVAAVPPPSRVRPDYPAALEAIVMCMLDPVPSNRFDSAAAVQGALESLALSCGAHLSTRSVAAFARGLSPVQSPADAASRRRAPSASQVSESRTSQRARSAQPQRMSWYDNAWTPPPSPGDTATWEDEPTTPSLGSHHGRALSSDGVTRPIDEQARRARRYARGSSQVPLATEEVVNMSPGADLETRPTSVRLRRPSS